MATPFYTVAQCQDMLTKLLDASMKLADGKSVSVTGSSGGRSITRMSADEIESSIALWERRLKEAQRGSTSRIRVRRVDPIR